MSPEQKAGQVLLPFFKGNQVEAHAALIQRLHLAGSIIMGDNVPRDPQGQVDLAAMGALNQRLQQAVAADGRRWPGIMSVDQEGGAVARLGQPLTEWPAPMSYGAAGNLDLTRKAGKGLASELVPLGFDLDFAPDTDVTVGPADPTIGARSMSADPAAAAQGTAFSQGMLDAGVLPTVKHFPGHGSVTADSHLSLPVQPAGLDVLRGRDWKPFEAAVAAGLPIIMTGHIAVPALEPGVPASLSAPSYATLRGLGFKGVAVTDALNMGAVENQYPAGAAAVKALAAGADLLLMPADAEQAHAAIVQALAAGTLPAARLDEAAQRVATMMIWHARTTPPAGTAGAGAPAGSGAALSAQVSASAVTVVSGPCSGPLVPGSVRVAGGGPGDRERFEAAAARAGVKIGSGPLVNLIGFGGRPAGGDIAVSLDAPWPLQESTAPVKLALYGRTDAAFDALVAVLAGKIPAPGKLPAAVGPFPAGTGCP